MRAKEKTKAKRSHSAARWMALAGLFGLLGVISCPAAGVVLVANAGVPDAALSASDVRNIFLGDKTQWSNGNRITPVMSTRPDVREAFLRSYVNRTDAQFRNHWRRIVFTGRWQMPRSYDDETELLDYVASTPGAVSFVGADTQLASNVKAIPVN